MTYCYYARRPPGCALHHSFAPYKSVDSGSPGPYLVGGHFNLDFSNRSLSAILTAAQVKGFDATFSRLPLDGSRQDAVFGKAKQGNYTLHSKLLSGEFYFHFDLYNPLKFVPFTTIAHLFADVIGGHNGTPCLDPAWAR